MPSTSAKQQRFFGAVLGRKRAGKSRPDDPHMSESDLIEFAGTVAKAAHATKKRMRKGK